MGARREARVKAHDQAGRSYERGGAAIADSARGDGKIKQLTSTDISGHTIIFNNLGGAGDVRGSSIITPATSAIYNLGRIDADGYVTIEMFFDHRIIDGALKGKFLEAVYQKSLVVIHEMRTALHASPLE